MILRTATHLPLVVILFFADRLLKWYAQSLPETGAAFLLGPFQFGYYLNPSLFFFPAWRFIPYLALIVLGTLSAFVIWNFIGNWKLEIGNLHHQALFFILLGGVSNVFDRFAYGGVIDYVNILHMVTINLADILIVTGLSIVLIQPYVKRS
ncbi:MAG: signal peptidase II [bacterium]|nr:signal peptidase II [bacterium]